MFASYSTPFIELSTVSTRDTDYSPSPTPQSFTSTRPSPASWQPSPDLWFDDGNIVVICASSAFKVHRGHLARHSEVFQSLFSIPQPCDAERFEGCDCVVFHDSALDMLYFLRALYDGL
jgi:hypothetical protein